jgi:hypothetical protein
MATDGPTILGYVLDVSLESAGSSVTTDAIAGATTLYLDDATDFAEGGGSLKLQSGVTVEYNSADMDADTLTLSSPLPLDVPEDTHIAVYPVANFYQAQIEVESYDDPILVRVPHHYWAFLPLGQRADDSGEQVRLWYDGNDWSIVDVGGLARVRLSNGVSTSLKTFRYTAEGIGPGGYLGVKFLDPYAGSIDTARLKLNAGPVTSPARFDIMINDASVGHITVAAGAATGSAIIGATFADGDKIRIDFTDPADATASTANPLQIWLDVTLAND